MDGISYVSTTYKCSIKNLRKLCLLNKRVNSATVGGFLSLQKFIFSRPVGPTKNKISAENGAWSVLINFAGGSQIRFIPVSEVNKFNLLSSLGAALASAAPGRPNLYKFTFGEGIGIPGP